MVTAVTEAPRVSNNGTSVPVTLAGSPAIGDVLVFATSTYQGPDNQMTGVSGGGVTTWTKLGSGTLAGQANGQGDSELWAGVVATAGQKTVTATFNLSVTGDSWLLRITGASGTLPTATVTTNSAGQVTFTGSGVGATIVAVGGLGDGIGGAGADPAAPFVTAHPNLYPYLSYATLTASPTSGTIKGKSATDGVTAVYATFPIAAAAAPVSARVNVGGVLKGFTGRINLAGTLKPFTGITPPAVAP